MKSRKELGEILKSGIEEGDTDTIWFVVGELEKAEDDKVMETIVARRAAYIQAYDDAINDVPIPEDEYYSSDAGYERAIEVLNDLIKELEDK